RPSALTVHVTIAVAGGIVGLHVGLWTLSPLNVLPPARLAIWSLRPTSRSCGHRPTIWGSPGGGGPRSGAGACRRFAAGLLSHLGSTTWIVIDLRTSLWPSCTVTFTV